MDAYGLPKQQRGVQQPDWVYKRRKYLKSLSVAERNFILTGDTAFAFDPVPYTVIYDCFTYADIVRGPAPVQPPQVVPNPVQVIAAPVQPPQVVPNPVQIVAAPIVIVPTIVRQRTPEPAAELDDIPELEDDSNPTSPCLLYTSPSPRDRTRSRMPSSA